MIQHLSIIPTPPYITPLTSRLFATWGPFTKKRINLQKLGAAITKLFSPILLTPSSSTTLPIQRGFQVMMNQPLPSTLKSRILNKVKTWTLEIYITMPILIKEYALRTYNSMTKLSPVMKKPFKLAQTINQLTSINQCASLKKFIHQSEARLLV